MSFFPSESELANWRKRVKDARSVYLQACEQHRRMNQELGHGAIPFQDGSFAIAKARRAEASALSEYRRAVAIYKSVLTGKNPPAE